MADEISNAEKLLAERNKLDKESNQNRKEFNRDLEKSTAETSDKFKALVNNLKEVQPETAKIVADFKNAGENTLKGALISRKLNLAMEAAAELEKKSFEELSMEQQSAIESMFGGNLEQLKELEGNLSAIKSKIETTEYQIAGMEDGRKINAEERAKIDEEITEVSKSLEQSAQEQEKINQAKQELLAMEQIDQRTLKKDAKIAFEQKKMELAGQMESSRLIIEGNKESDELAKEKVASLTSEKNALKTRDDELVAMIEEDKSNLEAYKEQNQDLLIEETNVREEMAMGLEQAKNDQLSGLTEFSEGLKGITGFDLIGQLDDAVKMFNNAQKVMSGVAQGFSKGVEYMKGISIEGMTEKFNNVMGTVQKGFNFAKTGLTNMAKRFMTTMSTFFASMVTFLTPIMIAAGGLLMAAAPWILLGLAVVGIVLAGMKLYEESEGFKAAIDTVIGYFMDIKDSIFRIFGGFFDFFKGLFTGDFDLMFSGLKETLGGIWDLIKSPFKAIGDFFKNVFGIDIMAKLKQMAKAILPGVVYRALFDDDVPEMNEEMKEKGLDAAEESGLYEKKGIGRASVVNPDMIITAPNNQLNAILADDDIGDETKELIVQELEARKSIIASYNEAKTALDSGQTNLADGSDAETIMEFAEEDMALRRGAQIDTATQEARPDINAAANAVASVVQQNNNNSQSTTNVMNNKDSARDENDRYYDDVMAGV